MGTIRYSYEEKEYEANTSSLAGCQRAAAPCMIQSTISIGSAENLLLLLGTQDQHLKQIRNTIPANISTRDGKILVQGDEADVIKATAVLEELRKRLRKEGSLNAEAVEQVLRRVASGQEKLSTQPIGVGGGRSILPRTQGQADYVQAIRDNALVFCTGPAGTGKTYLAVAAAVEALQAQRNSQDRPRPSGSRSGRKPGVLAG